MFRPKQMHSCARNRALETREDGGTLEKFKLWTNQLIIGEIPHPHHDIVV